MTKENIYIRGSSCISISWTHSSNYPQSKKTNLTFYYLNTDILKSIFTPFTLNFFSIQMILTASSNAHLLLTSFSFFLNIASLMSIILARSFLDSTSSLYNKHFLKLNLNRNSTFQILQHQIIWYSTVCNINISLLVGIRSDGLVILCSNF